MLDWFNISNCKAMYTPLYAHLKLSFDSCPKSDVYVTFMSKDAYSSAIGSLICMMWYD